MVPSWSKNTRSVGLWSIQPPPTTASNSSATPMAEPSTTRPGRMPRMYSPISMAIGMVAKTVEVAHGLCFIALTTTSASTAIRITMIASVPIWAAKPPTGPSSSRAIWPSERPLRRVETNSTSMSCTQPPSTDPIRIQSVPGR